MLTYCLNYIKFICMRNSIPVITANFLPFRIILKNESEIPWVATLDQINTNNYDLDSLNEIVGVIDIGIKPYSLAFSRDGTLHLPRINKYQDLGVALFEFNQFLTCVLLGGEEIEFVWSDDIGFGFILENKTSIICSNVNGKAGNFHKLAKAGFLAQAEAIKLAYPNYLNFKKIKKSYLKGKSIVETLGGLSLQPILYGATFYKNRNYSESLIAFWSITEILIELFWKKKILSTLDVQNIAPKINALYENAIINIELKEGLDIVRKARNRLAHRGKLPAIADVQLSIKCVFQILSLVITNFERTDEYHYLIEMLNNTNLVNAGAFNVDQEVKVPTWFEILENQDDVNFINI